MKKFLVIGNPINHSLSPKLHNYWIKKNNLDSIYGKLEVNENELSDLCNHLKQGKLDGINITVPFKKAIIPHIDVMTGHALRTNSINTISVDNGNLIGHNTDIDGFKLAIKNTGYEVNGKKILILGAGGVVPSIIFALNKMGASEIILSNRTKHKAETLKKLFKNLSVVDWGQIPYFDMIVNATSLGLNSNENINLDFSKIEKEKFFYDVIYNPKETSFLKKAKAKGNKIENGKKMFIYQAAASFNIWHDIYPKINNQLDKFLN